MVRAFSWVIRAPSTNLCFGADGQAIGTWVSLSSSERDKRRFHPVCVFTQNVWLSYCNQLPKSVLTNSKRRGVPSCRSSVLNSLERHKLKITFFLRGWWSTVQWRGLILCLTQLAHLGHFYLFLHCLSLFQYVSYSLEKRRRSRK